MEKTKAGTKLRNWPQLPTADTVAEIERELVGLTYAERQSDRHRDLMLEYLMTIGVVYATKTGQALGSPFQDSIRAYEPKRTEQDPVILMQGYAAALVEYGQWYKLDPNDLSNGLPGARWSMGITAWAAQIARELGRTGFTNNRNRPYAGRTIMEWHTQFDDERKQSGRDIVGYEELLRLDHTAGPPKIQTYEFALAVFVSNKWSPPAALKWLRQECEKTFGRRTAPSEGK